MTSALITGLTEEEIERLRAWESEHSRELGYNEGHEKGCEDKGFDDVDRLVADGYYDEESACEVLGVDITAYGEYKAGKE